VPGDQSDVPGGVVNLITGRAAEIAPWLASHRDVNAIDLTGAADARRSVLG
jgi:acyl-CoA reductase-like NAD-dependent aldehyde dehydrogenase